MSGISKPVPTNKLNYVGIELEFDLPNKDVFKSLKDCLTKHLPCSTIHYEHIAFTSGGLKDYAYEVTLLCVEDDYEYAVSILLSALKQAGAFIDDRCGLHVHLDMRQRDKQEQYLKFVDHQDFLFTKVAKHRINNQYCERSSKTFQWKHSAIYKSMDYVTLEIRMKESVLDDEAICDWVALLVSIVNNKFEVSNAA